MLQFGHALSIGGTGMLVRASAYLAAHSRTLTVLARRPERGSFDATGASIHRVACDYRDAGALEAALAAAQARSGAFDIALAWIHGDAHTALSCVGRHLHPPGARIVRVVGSAYASPEGKGRDHGFLPEVANLTRQTVILGFAIESGGSRWLTDEEISGAAIDAIATPEHAITIAGTVTPWSLRP